MSPDVACVTIESDLSEDFQIGSGKLREGSIKNGGGEKRDRLLAYLDNRGKRAVR